MKNRDVNNFLVFFYCYFLFYYFRYTFTRASSQVFLFTFSF